MSRNLFLIPLWKRPEITKICLRNLQYFEQAILCIVSCDEDAQVCYDLNVPFVWWSNDWLGAKWNHGLFVARPMQWDYIVTLGSDDLVKESLFDFYKTEQDVLIMDKIHFTDINSGQSILINRARIGAGRRISRKVVEACNYKLWTDQRNKSLDMDSSGIMNRAGFATTETSSDPHILGIKSETNIWSFEHLRQRCGINVPKEKAFDGLPLETKKSLDSLLLQRREQKINFVKT